MAEKNQEKIIKAIEALQAKLEADMESALPKIFKDLSEEVIDLVSELSLDPEDRAKNLRDIIDLKRRIGDALIGNALYQAEVVKVIEGFKELANLSDDFMSVIFDDYTRKNDLYKAVLKANIDLTKDALLGAGIRDNFSNAIREVLKANISGVGDTRQLRKVLTQFITGSETEKPFLERYITQVTNDSIMIFNQEYLNTVSEDLDVQYYIYSGTIIGDSRPFCVSRAGRLFTKEQVKSWGKLGSWQGKIPGTNEQTIFTYRGGYNCRHTIWPQNKVQYENAVNEGRAGLQ
jgi:hypothetical protein